MIKKLYEFNKEATLSIYNDRINLNNSIDKKYNWYKLYWNNERSQIFRFKNLLKIGVKNGDTVLDFGCGYGDLYDYIESIDLNIDYVGVGNSSKNSKKIYEKLLNSIILNYFSKNEFFILIYTIYRKGNKILPFYKTYVKSN